MKRSAPPEDVTITVTTVVPESEPSTSTAVPVTTEDKEEDTGNEGDTPFHLLIKAARLMNPVQFELSKDIACSTPLPG